MSTDCFFELKAEEVDGHILGHRRIFNVHIEYLYLDDVVQSEIYHLA